MAKYINPLTDVGKGNYALSTMHYALSEAQYASLNTEERHAYDADLKAYRDITNQLAYAGMKGEAKKAREIACEMLAEGMPVSTIARLTKLSEAEVKALQDGR